MSRFCPCIDLHEGRVKQIIGGTLEDGKGAVENYCSPNPPSYYAEMFRDDALHGGHVIQLGPGNESAAKDALSTWPDGLRLGGGVNLRNATEWLELGAKEVIVTSYLFDGEGVFSWKRLKKLSSEVGEGHLVIDLSSRQVEKGWRVAMNRWQTLTQLELSPNVLDDLAQYCSGFLVHAADVEGKCGGIDEGLVKMLGTWRGKSVTYAGGVGNISDVLRVEELSGGHVDVTVGSALDIYGGTGVCYEKIKEWSKK